MSASSSRMNCYEVLGIAQDADIKEINSAYKRLALQYHPDKTGGDNVSVDEFRKIQQAVEILRDPTRRALHDDELDKRSHAPFVHQPQPTRDPFAFGGGWARDPHHTSEMSDLADPHYRGWRPQRYNWWTDRYMFSYSHSVHMSPDEQDSVEERARSDRMRREYEEWRQSLFGDERAGQARSREAMSASVMRDEEELRCADDEASVEGHHPMDAAHASLFSHGVGDGSHDWEEKQSAGEVRVGGTRGSSAGQHRGDQVQQTSGGARTDEDGLGGRVHEQIQVDHQSVASTCASFTEYETARDSSSDDGTVFYDCRDFEDQSHHTSDDVIVGEARVEHQAEEQDQASRAATPADNYSTTTPSEAATSAASSEHTQPRANLTYEQVTYRDTLDPLNTETESPLAPFIPYFNAKLTDPSGRYTPEDLNIEIRGLILETYCGWLEDLRLRVPGARPLETGLHPQRCSHLGFWEKDFRPIECEACQRWMPIYTLTCPGCGIKACVSCKFEYAQM
ncbi:hypothetical protein HFD88_008154 [Aspergillus terreus]|nr:hypothetical protein HFD88_008154 [Aspergillus terreus]